MIPLDLTEVLKNAPPGEWIALSEDQTRIVGVGETPGEAIEDARRNGEDNPFLTKVTPATGLIL
jgi:uncharacterized protein DUF5678